MTNTFGIGITTSVDDGPEVAVQHALVQRKGDASLLARLHPT
jgi:hypothetical protein